MKMPLNRSTRALRHHQQGMTLMEAMISLALSLIVTSAMVVLMANSLGTTTRIIQMSQLSDQMRNSMSMMTRDVRRADYTANAVYCYSNPACTTGGAINIVGNTCFTFTMDRNQDGDTTTDSAGGFRMVTNGGIGQIEVWTGGASPNCGATDANWVAVTDPDFINITQFNVDDLGSFSGTVTGEDETTVTVNTRQIRVQMTGQLIRDNTITRQLEDVIRVRNDTVTVT